MARTSVWSYRLKPSTCSAHEMTDSQFHLLTSSSNSTTTAGASPEIRRQRLESIHPSSSSVQSNCIPRNFDLFVGIMNRIAIDITKAITPPSLFGIDRRIAYANRKYHSG